MLNTFKHLRNMQIFEAVPPLFPDMENGVCLPQLSKSDADYAKMKSSIHMVQQAFLAHGLVDVVKNVQVEENYWSNFRLT
jgi:hypothetical protein